MNCIRFLFLGVFAFSFFACSKNIQKNERPNILMIMVDDLGFSDLGCYGGEINTPNLDQLADEGIRFAQFHNTAKCHSSRATLMTGLYQHQMNMGRKEGKLQNCVTFGEVLKEAGYRTLMVGKHHGYDNMYDRGFDRYFGLRDGAVNHFNPGKQREGEPKPGGKGPIRTWCIDSVTYKPYTPKEKDFYSTDYYTKYAMNYLEEYKGENKPFFMYLAYTAPHDPLMAWAKDIEKYRGKYLVGYEKIREARYKKQKDLGIIDDSFPLSDPTYEDWMSLSQNEKLTRDSLMATYAAMIDCLDQNIGKLITKLKQLGEYENTLIMFVSDNGCQSRSMEAAFIYNKTNEPIGTIGSFTSLNTSWANVSNTPYRFYKQDAHAGGVCTPFIVHWPKEMKNFQRGINMNYPGHLFDIMPTLLDVTGASYPKVYKGDSIPSLVGESLLPIWKGEKQNREKPVFQQFGSGKSVRIGDYKLVSSNRKPWELYNITTEKTEITNLIDSEPEKAEELKESYNEWWKVMKPKRKKRKEK